MIEYKIYSNNERDLWNKFVDNAKDSTIFQSQIFLAYHLQRNFSNHSLMFYKNKILIGIFTGSSMTNANGEKILFSHPGASFGGIIQNTSSLSDTLEMIDLIDRSAKVIPVMTTDYPTPAKRPSYSLLDCSTTRQILELKALHWRDALHQTLKEIPS